MDAVFSVGLEFNMTGGIVPLNGFDQAQNARVDHVFKQYMRREPIMNPLGNVLDLRQLLYEQPLALR
jgi:hypothetical protein